MYFSMSKLIFYKMFISKTVKLIDWIRLVNPLIFKLYSLTSQSLDPKNQFLKSHRVIFSQIESGIPEND